MESSSGTKMKFERKYSCAFAPRAQAPLSVDAASLRVLYGRASGASFPSLQYSNTPIFHYSITPTIVF